MNTKTGCLAVLLPLLMSCGRNEGIKSGDRHHVSALSISPPPVLQAGIPNDVSQLAPLEYQDKSRIIKDGNVSIRTKDLKHCKSFVDSAVSKLKAYYELEEMMNDELSIRYELRVRIPATRFEEFLSILENGSDQLTFKRIVIRDATEEYVDLEGRLGNKRDYMNRYREILGSAKTAEDMLAIEENIRKLQEEIESTLGRLKYIDDRAAYSTLILRITQEKEYAYKPEEKDSFAERGKASLAGGWNHITDSVLWTIGWWPYLILLVFLIYLFKRLRRKSAA